MPPDITVEEIEAVTRYGGAAAPRRALSHEGGADKVVAVP
jgi:hypothetical protein